MCQAMDLRNSSVPVFYGRNTDMDGWLTRDIHAHLKKFEEWLLFHNTPFTAGDSPTVGDFHLWEIVDHNELLAKREGMSVLADYKALSSFYARFRALPELEKYFASDLYSLPINNTHAKFL
mmetsp:Transcript_22276/g.31481  ORF Transcript_22276/g.31481 Transcript_22276/m.31481 type:complete len:121 (+) Transcript_22276:32-394(+)